MSRFLLAAAAASLAFAAPATAGERKFTHAGVTYTYTSVTRGDTRILEGSASQGGEFKLIVKDGWVRGNVGSTRVSYPVPKGETAILVAQR